MLNPNDIQSIGQLPKANRQKLPLAPGDDVEGSSWKNLVNLRLRVEGNNVFWVARGGSTIVNSFFGNVLTVKALNTRVGSVAAEYLAVHTSAGKVYLWDLEAEISDEIASAGFSTTEQIQIFNIGRFVYLFNYDGSYSRFYDLKEKSLHPYLNYNRAYIHTQSWLSEDLDKDTENLYNFKKGEPIIVFPNINFKSGEQVFTSVGLADGEQASFNPKIYNENSFYYTYTDGGKYLEDIDGKVYKQSQFITFRRGTENFGFTVRGTGTDFTIDRFYIPLNENGVPTFESYKARIFNITSSIISWKDPVGSEQSATIGGVPTGEEEVSNMVFPYNSGLENMIGLPCRYKLNNDGSDIEENTQYVRPSIYRQYVIFELLKDGSVTQLGLPYQLKVDSTDLLVNGRTGVTLTATTPDSAVAERYLASTRWHMSADAAFNPSTEIHPNSPLFIVGPFITSDTIIRDKTSDEKLIRPVVEFIPMVAGVMDLFGPGELAPNSIARFRNSLMQAGYTVSRPIPSPYGSASSPGGGNIFTNITETTQLPNNMALSFLFEYSDGMKSEIVETETFLQEGTTTGSTESTCGQVKGTANHSVTNGADYDGQIIVEYDGYQLAINLNTSSHGGTLDAAEAIRAAIEADFDIDISAAIDSAPEINYTEKRYGEEFNGKVINYIDVAPWDLGGGAFVQSYASSNGNTNGITFNDTGTLMLVSKDANDRIEEYTLSTPWDISTASPTGNYLDVTSQDSVPRCITFNDNGTWFYMVGNSSDSVWQYPLSTPYDITTFYAAHSYSIATEITDPHALDFSTDGLKMYVSSSSEVYEYDLGTAWDVRTASYTPGKTVNVSTQSTSIGGIQLKDNGTKLFLDDNSTVYEYDLPTAWDISSASYQGTILDVSAQTAGASALFISAGLRLYLLEGSTGVVFQYSLPSSIGLTFDTEPLTISGAKNPEDQPAKGYIVSDFNGLNSGQVQNVTVTIGANTTASIELLDSDSLDTIVTKIRSAINTDATISTDWSATPPKIFEIDGQEFPGITIESVVGGVAWNDIQFQINYLDRLSVSFQHGAPGEPWSPFNNLTKGGATACTHSEGYYDVSANTLGAGVTEDHVLTLDGVSTPAITITDTDTTEQIADKYITAIESKTILDRKWRGLKVDQGGGTWRFVAQHRVAGTAYNGLVISITGNSAVTVTVTSPTSGGTGGDDVPSGPAVPVSANLIQIHSLNALVKKVYILGRTNDGTKRFHLLEEVQITDPGAQGRVIELPATESELNEIELNNFEAPSVNDVIETVELQNYVNVGTPAQQFNISTQEEAVDESRIIKAIPLEFDVDKSTMRYRVMLFTDQNIQVGYLVDATVRGSRIFNGDFETIFEGLQASNRFGIERRNGLIIWSTGDSLYAWSGRGGPNRLMDRRRYEVSKNNEHQDVIYNANHNELWLIYRDNEIITIDLDSQSVHRISYPTTIRAGVYYDGKMYIASSTNILWTDQDDVYQDEGTSITVTAETDYFGDELSQIRLLDLTVGGQAFNVTVGLDYQDERYIDIGTGWQDGFETDQSFGPKTLNMAGKVYSLYRYAIMPRLKLSMEAIAGGFLSHVILKYVPTSNEGQARE